MSERFKSIAKNGWHPEKPSSSSGSGSGSSGGMRDRVSGLLSKPLGGSGSTTSESRGAAMPISSLRDPNSFGPPPKHIAAGGPVTQTSPSTYQSRQPPALPPTSSKPASLSAGSPSYNPSPVNQQFQYDEEQPKPPPKPFKIDNSGLSTSHLPPPPARRDGADGRTPGTGPLGPGHSPRTPTSPAPPARTRGAQSPATAGAGGNRPGPPSLPPRLPPRGASGSPAPPSVLPARTPATTGVSSPGGYINTAAANRLGAAGISVPGFGIGGGTTTTTPSNTTPAAAAGGGGTTWAQKQAALRTASQFNKDPSSVSFADAKAAASTANNFRERHGAQVASGLRTANSLNQRFGAHMGTTATPETSGDARSTGIRSAAAAFGGAAIAVKNKAAPPPPPKKKPELPGLNTTSTNDGGPPPPVPLATRPTF